MEDIPGDYSSEAIKEVLIPSSPLMDPAEDILESAATAAAAARAI